MKFETPFTAYGRLTLYLYVKCTILYYNIIIRIYPTISINNIVILVISMPKLPRLIAEYILMPNAVKNNGYTINQLVSGTVNETAEAITIFSTQLTVSIHNLPGWLYQSS